MKKEPLYSEEYLQQSSLVFFDVETTGLDPYKGDRICEIGAVKYTAGARVETFKTLVNPRREIPPFVSQIHTITDDDVKDAPGFEDVAETFLSFIDKTILAGYNVEFDLGFINAELKQTGRPLLRFPSLDVLLMARKAIPGLGRYNLGYVSGHLELTSDTFHRAYDDALLTSKVYFNLKEKLAEKGVTRMSDLLTLFGVHNEFFTRMIEPKVALIREAIDADLELKVTCLSRHDILTMAVKPKELAEEVPPVLIAIDIKTRRQITMPLSKMLAIEIY